MEGQTTTGLSIWSSLGADSFRVLRINQVEPEISTELIERQHSDISPYYALSYAWGDQKSTWNISCQQTDVAVTPHLHEALRCIVKLYGKLDLFVDAICIDQHNPVEKAQQVGNMYKVYSRAARVLVWLGQEEDDSAAAIEYIRSLEYSLPTISQLMEARGVIPLPPGLDDAQLLQAIWQLNMRPWYFRLWVFQEVVLAGDFDIICGQSRVSGNTFTQFALNMKNGNFFKQAVSVLGVKIGRERIGFVEMAAITLARERRAERSPGTFAVSVHNSRDRDVREPIDRIYGLLGLDVSIGAYYRENIVVDYSASALLNYKQVYIDFAKLALDREPCLSLLSMTSSDTRFTGLPSWCPNFSSGIETHRIMMIEYRAGWPRDSALSSAAAGKAAIRSRAMFKGKWANHVTTSATSDKIKVWGCIIDVVKDVAKHNPIVRGTKGLFVPELLSWLNEILDMARKLPHASDEDLPDSYWRTLVGDFDSITAAFPAAPAHIERCRAFRRCLELQYKQFVLVGSLEPMKPELARLMADKSWQSSFDNYVFQLNRIWYNRTFFTTAGGRTGFASTRVRTGDSICVLYGGPSIYVLRQKPGQEGYEFIDDGFTLGLMDGEAFDLLASGTCREQEFIIE